MVLLACPSTFVKLAMTYFMDVFSACVTLILDALKVGLPLWMQVLFLIVNVERITSGPE